MDYIIAYYRSEILDKYSDCSQTRILIRQIKYKDKSACLLLYGNPKKGKAIVLQENGGKSHNSSVARQLLDWFDNQEWNKAFRRRGRFLLRAYRDLRHILEEGEASMEQRILETRKTSAERQQISKTDNNGVGYTVILAVENCAIICGEVRNVTCVNDFLGQGTMSRLQTEHKGVVIELRKGVVVLMAAEECLDTLDSATLGNALKSQVIQTEEQAGKHLREVCKSGICDAVYLLVK